MCGAISSKEPEQGKQTLQPHAAACVCDASSFFLECADFQFWTAVLVVKAIVPWQESTWLALCLDTSYKQGLISLLVQCRPGPEHLIHTPGLFWGFCRLNDRTQFELSCTNGLLEVPDSCFPQFDPWHSSLRGRNEPCCLWKSPPAWPGDWEFLDMPHPIHMWPCSRHVWINQTPV